DRGRKGKSGKKAGGEVFEETMQVRVRRKNPLIERLVSDPPNSRTNAEVSPMAPPLAEASIYDEEESSETTQEFDLHDREALVDRLGGAKKRVRSSNKKARATARVHAPAPSVHADEDATVIADEAPTALPAPAPDLATSRKKSANERAKL